MAFLDYSQNIETLSGANGTLYIGGQFILNVTNNIAKYPMKVYCRSHSKRYNLTTNQFDPFQSIFPGPIFTFELIPSSITLSNQAVIYAGGYVSSAGNLSSPNGVAGSVHLSCNKL
jgi:hypothetical protein